MTMNPTRPDAADDAASPATSPQPWFARLARFSATHRRGVMIVWLIATLAAAPLAVTLTPRAVRCGLGGPGLDLGRGA